MDARVGATRLRALVTGASSGIGQAFAERLAADGYDLTIVARRRERLEALAERLTGAHGVTVRALGADLTDPAALRTVEEHIAGDAALALLVNNAGFAGYMPFIQLEPDRAEGLIRLHILATTRLTRAALPGMVSRGTGAIINVSSLLGFSASVPASSPLPKRAVYAACKAYITAFTELLRQEVEGTGVQVEVVCPGLTGGTEFHDNIPGFDAARLQSAGITAGIDPHGIVRAALAGLRLGEGVCVPGLDDPALVAEVHLSERRLLERAARSKLAGRYTG